MLINCPRCGFQQPQDTYCAQCGVDMTQFKPNRPPVWKRFFFNPLLQIFLFLVVITSAFLFLYKGTENDLSARENFLRSSVQVRSSAPVGQAQAVVVEEEISELASEESTQVTAERNTPPQETPPPPTLPALGELQIDYLEVSTPTLNALIESSRQRGQFMNFPDYAAGIIANYAQVAPQISAEKLDTKAKKLNREHNLLQWDHTVSHENDVLGLTSFFEIVEATPQVLRGNLEIQRSWRETGDDLIQKKSFPAIFELAPDSAFFVTGVIPQNPGPDEEELAKVAPFKILKSPKYRSGESELVIIFRYLPQRPQREGTP